MSAQEEEAIVDAMSRFGGSFVQRLAELYRRADVHNQRRIREAWPEYWAQYRDLAERAHRRPPQ